MPQTAHISISATAELQLHEHSTATQCRELAGFVRDTIDRIERDAGRTHSWRISIAPDRAFYCCTVIVRRDDVIVRATGNGFHGAVAGREAFRKVEELLRANLLDREEVTCGSR